jgi:hypothetical protein
LVQAGEALGGRYHLVFRGYHALAGVILIALFVWVCRARSWTDVAALAAALAVLTGMHTFVGLFRESFPVNHYLIVAVSALATFALAQSRGGWLADLAAIVLLGSAALTFESGLLVWPVAVAAYAGGLRGISGRGIVLMTAVVVLYAGLRVGYLGKQGAGVGERGTGFGSGALTQEEQIERFGNRPLVLYAYNATMTAASVLLSQPQIGRFTVVSAWNNGSLPPVFIVQIASSLLTTALIAWYVFSRGPTGSRRWREPVPLDVLRRARCERPDVVRVYEGRDHQHGGGVLRDCGVCGLARAVGSSFTSVGGCDADRRRVGREQRVGDSIGGSAPAPASRRIRSALRLGLCAVANLARGMAKRRAHATGRLENARGGAAASDGRTGNASEVDRIVVGRGLMRRWITIAMSGALALPPVAVLVAFAASGAAALTTGQPLFWPAQTVTLTEAVGMHDSAEIVRQIALGANPNIRYDTWDILKRYQHVSVTPLEAAVATREQYLFESSSRTARC